MDEDWHGTRRGYRTFKCRCDKCRDFWNTYYREYTRQRKASFTDSPNLQHGTYATYQRGCQCEECAEGARIYRRARRYTLPADEFERIFAAQGGRCAICERQPASRSDMVVDHDHAAGTVRGLLCRNCNSGIGLLGDSAETLRAAALYIERICVTRPLRGKSSH